MRTALLLVVLATGTAGLAPVARACDGHAALPEGSRTLPEGGGTYASGAPPRNGYREAPSVPLSSLPTLPPTRGYTNPATGYYAPGPAVGVDQRPIVQPAPRRVTYPTRYGYRRVYRR